MKNTAIVMAAFMLAALTGPAMAQPLAGDDIKSTISGKTVVLKTSLGSMPLAYGANGSVVGDGSGTGLGKFFAPKETGTWWVKGDSMCQKFKTWYKGRTFCFKLEPAGTGKLKWTRNDGYSGSAVIRY